MKNEEIRIGSRVKIKENTGYFDEKCHPLSLKGRVGIVVDDAGNDMMTVLFPGWGKGHDGSVCSRSKRNFGNTIDTCQYIPLNVLEVVHDGFEIGDKVKIDMFSGTFTGEIVDYSSITGAPLVDFSESKGVKGWKVASKQFHNGSLSCLIDSSALLHSFNCYYCPYGLLTLIEPNSELCGKSNVEKNKQGEYLKDNEEIKIGSRVKIKSFYEKVYPSSLKERTGIVVDDAIGGSVMVLFPGWEGGHNGCEMTASGMGFGNTINTCWDLYKMHLEVVHDGFEIGDRVKVIIRDNAFTGKIVDYNRISGDPLVDFSESKGTEGWKAASWLFHNGSPFGVIDSLTQPHSFNCYYLSCDRITPIKSDSEKEKEPTGFLFGVYSHLDGTLCIRNAEGKEVSAATLAEILASISEKD